MSAIAIILGCAVALIATSAHAQTIVPPRVGILPPIEFDYPFEGSQLIIQRGNKEKMESDCPKQTPMTMACAFRKTGVPDGQPSDYCRIVIANDELLHERIRTRGFWTYDIILRHEMGHCNGWGPGHFGARPADAPAGQSPTWKSLQSARLTAAAEEAEEARIRQRDARSTELYETTYKEVWHHWQSARWSYHSSAIALSRIPSSVAT
jgi:hypothetical protein